MLRFLAGINQSASLLVVCKILLSVHTDLDGRIKKEDRLTTLALDRADYRASETSTLASHIGLSIRIGRYNRTHGLPGNVLNFSLSLLFRYPHDNLRKQN